MISIYPISKDNTPEVGNFASLFLYQMIQHSYKNYIFEKIVFLWPNRN